jgi:DNA-binding transcriptional ArsR family regulator
MSAGAIGDALERPRPGVSHHLSVLLDRGLIKVQVSGTTRIYSIDHGRALAAWNELLDEAFENGAAREAEP